MNIRRSITNLPLAPYPAHCELAANDHRFNLELATIYANQCLSEYAEVLHAALDLPKHNVQLDAERSGKSPAIALNLNAALDSDYELIIGVDTVSLTGRDETQMFYGVQTLIQLAQSLGPYLPTLEIRDTARCKYRGLHLDVSRHFYPVDNVKRVLDLMAMHKLNHFHWHLVDDQGWRLEIDAFPDLVKTGSHRPGTVTKHTLDRDNELDNTPHRGFYTKQDIRDIVAYAKARHITVIPEIDLPGHSSALLTAYPVLACHNAPTPPRVQTHFGIFTQVLCNRESTFTFLETLFTELAVLFPGPYVHIGGDEVKKTHWDSCPDCQQVLRDRALSNSEALHGYFIQRVTKILANLNKRAICWDDVLDSDNLDQSVKIMSWLGEEKACDALTRGHDVIMTQSKLYFDFYQSLSIDEPFAIHGHAPLKEVYNYDPLEHSDTIQGVQANVWTEYIDTMPKLEYALLPRLAALAEIAWTPKSQQSWTAFRQRIPALLERYEKLGYHAADSVFVPQFNVLDRGTGYLRVALHSEFPQLPIYFTSDGTRPTEGSSAYQQPLLITEPTLLHAGCFSTDNKPASGVVPLFVFPHHAMGCKVVAKDSALNLIEIDHLNQLTNGLPQQGVRFQHAQWALFEALDSFHIDLDLRTTQTFSTISVGFDGALGRSLYFPVSVTVHGSQNEQDWKVLGQLQPSQPTGRWALSSAEHTYRFLRFSVDNRQTIYSFEDARDIIPPLYVDEITVT
ncbi:beta-N-acetylhexosaminidase [Arenicella chitinivorans]|uniref:beta-N-acetylhexosaminidase n=1 Tax=Arenicella chitinivorans TaxID=1329800 RepID=UPI0016771A24|nr:family 20 glycosylhydrolase [Arenicella chitinivorans]